MILESYYWKKDLIKISEKLKKRKNQIKWFESSFAALEKEIMMGFYSIRKLVESKKISNNLFEKKRNLKAYARKNTRLTFINNHDIEKHFDFRKPKTIPKDLMFICNMVIHSYILSPSFNKFGKLEAIFVTSDKQRKYYIFELTISSICKIFKEVGNNYPSESLFKYCKKVNDYRVTNK